MWLFDEPLWYLRRKVSGSITAPDVSLNTFGPAGNLRYRTVRDSKWAFPTLVASWLYSWCMYAFLYTVCIYFGDIRDRFGLSNSHLSAIVVSSFAAHYLASKLWTTYCMSLISVKTTAVLFSMVSAAISFVFYLVPNTTTLCIMTVTKGICYGVIITPTNLLAAHYCLGDLERGTSVMQVGAGIISVFMPSMIHVTRHWYDLDWLFGCLSIMDTITYLLSFVILPRTFIFTKVASLSELGSILCSSSSPTGYPEESQNSLELSEAKEDTLHQQRKMWEENYINICLRPSTREERRAAFAKCLQENPGGLSAYARTLEDNQNIIPHFKIPLVYRLFHPYAITIFTPPGDEKWFFTYPKLRWAVLGLSFLQVSIISILFFPSLLKELGATELDIITLMTVAGASFCLSRMFYRLLVIWGKVFEARTVIWMTAIGMGVIGWYIDGFNTYPKQVALAAGIGAVGLSSVSLSVEHLSEFYEDGSFGCAIGSKNLLGLLWLALMLTTHGFLLDFVSFRMTYTFLAGCMIWGGIFVFLPWAYDKIRSCCRSSQCSSPDSDKRPLKDGYEPV